MTPDYKPPRPLQHSPEMKGDIMQDRASTLNPEIRSAVLDLVSEARSLFSNQQEVVAVINDVVHPLLEEGVSLSSVCKQIKRIEDNEVGHWNISLPVLARLTRFLGHARRKMGQTLETFRDPTIPLYPQEFVRLNTKRFPDKPWYIGGIQYMDSHSGTTGGSQVPHCVMVRIPEFVDHPNMRFGADFFDRENYVKDVMSEQRPFMMRVHSECFLGETIDHDRCDCSIQLHHAMNEIDKNGLGAIIYLRQEARGAGLSDKFRFFGLVDGRDRRGDWIGQGKYDTKTSMTVLGHQEDTRTFQMAVRMLRGIGVTPDMPITMITNNPGKTRPFTSEGYTVNRVPGAEESVCSAEAVSEIILLKIIDQGHEVPWKQLQDYLEPFLHKIQAGEIDIVDIRIRSALTQLGHHIRNGNVKNCAPELREWVTNIWPDLEADQQNHIH